MSITPKQTLRVPEAGAMLGISRSTAYHHVAETGELAGVQVLRVGKQVLVPRLPFLRALGIESDADRGAAV